MKNKTSTLYVFECDFAYHKLLNQEKVYIYVVDVITQEEDKFLYLINITEIFHSFFCL